MESIKHLSNKEQAEFIADKFCKVSQEFEPLKSEDIKVPVFEDVYVPKCVPIQVQKELEKIRTNKAVPPGDVPAKLTKMFAAQLSIPLCDIINFSIKNGKWSRLYKCESITPVPKVFPPNSVDELRNISGLLTFNKVAEKMISELLIYDMSDKLDPASASEQGVMQSESVGSSASLEF